MAISSQYTIGVLNADNFCEPIISAGNLAITTDCKKIAKIFSDNFYKVFNREIQADLEFIKNIHTHQKLTKSGDPFNKIKFNNAIN